MMDRHRALGALLVDDAEALGAHGARRYLASLTSRDATEDAQLAAQVVRTCVASVRHLGAALSTGRGELFDEYIRWAASMEAGRGTPGAPLDGAGGTEVLEPLVEAIAERTESSDAAIVRDVVSRSLAALPADVQADRSHLETEDPSGALAVRYLDALLRGDRQAAIGMVLAAADDGVPLETLYLDVFQPCLWEMGRRWQTGTVTVAQEHFVTAATQLAMAQLYPRLFATPRIGRSVVVASVGGELHELGGRMVADIFELRGWDSRFVGANTPADSVAQLASDIGADVVAVSATLPSHVPAVEAVVEAVRRRSDARVIVGGRPFNRVPDLWQVVGADATAEDAVAAVAAASSLVAAA